jgi:bifunctional UDP-N-acetylglucosamine pyrophosphorylase/glucosamine-1-phosphate N-acetyltransferase
MNKQTIQAIVLAAGKSTRFNTDKSKLLTPLCGQELILYPLKALAVLEIPITVVVGHQKEQLITLIQDKNFNNLSFIEQKEQKGTGHAVLITKDLWHADNILIINGDMPLVSSDIINKLITEHQTQNATLSFVTAHNPDPTLTGYGRVIKEKNSVRIVEDKHFTGDKTQPCYINAGIYLIKREFLKDSIQRLKPNTQSGEIYLTDLIELACADNKTVTLVDAPFDSIRGINTLKELWIAEQIKRAELINYWMERGVYFPMAQTVHIDSDVEIGKDTIIDAGVQLSKGTRIGKGCRIAAYSILSNALVHDSVTIYAHSVIANSEVYSGATIGPQAHVHNSIVHINAQIGNFVEISRATIGAQSKAKHLTYLGDAHIGSQVNIGAGTITCNYNGVTKNKTYIGDNTHIGSNNSLVAPLVVGKDVITGAGSTITQEVPDGALAIARAYQVNKENYAKQLKERYIQKNKALLENPPENAQV